MMLWRSSLLVCSLVVLLILLFRGVSTGNAPAMAAPDRQTTSEISSTATRILLTDPVPDPHQDGVVWFAATGHTLRGEFLDYWNKNGGLAQFGYPITEEFTEPSGPGNKPLAVQYFERNRFEHHPENAGTPYEVLLGTLGTQFHAPDPPAAPAAGAEYSSETGHNIWGEFKTYWETHGGLAVHGYPITEQFRGSEPH